MNPQSPCLPNLPSLVVSFAAGVFFVFSTSAATFEWSGARGDNLWATPGNWNPNGPPDVADLAVFGDLAVVPDATTVNNIVGVDRTIAGLSYTNSASFTWNVTEISGNKTLTVNGPFIVGGGNNTGLSTSAVMTGGGNFVATGTVFALGNTASSGSATPGNLDLSGLSTFTYFSTNGTLGIGRISTGTGSRSTSIFIMAASSNHITAGTIDMNGATGTASQPEFDLGAGTNVINANTFNVGAGRSTDSKFQFYDAMNGGLKLRGTGGADTNRSSMVVGNRNTGGTGTKNTKASVLLTGHPIDLKIGTLTLGTMTRNASGSDTGAYNPLGLFEFDQGIVDATTINMGVCSGNSTNSTATGTLTIGGNATLLVGNVSLANVSTVAENCSASGTLNIAGGTVNCTGSIIKSTTTGSTGAVAVVNASLLVGGAIGNVTNPVDYLLLSDGIVTLAAGYSTAANVTTLETAGSKNLINISTLDTLTNYPTRLPLIQYTGTIAGSGFDNNITLGTLPTVSPAYQGYLSNNTANSTIELVITGGPSPSRSLTWNGVPNGDWDTTTANWRVSGNSTTYNQNDTVLFDDSASGTTSVNLTTALKPVSLTINNTTKN